MAIEQGELFFHDFGPRQNHLKEGPRPIVVVQTNHLNRMDGYPNVIVVPITTKPRTSPTYVRIEPSPINDLDRTSWAITNQIFTVDKGELKKRLGMVSASELHEIREGLQVALGML